MDSTDVSRAIDAALAIADGLGLAAERAIVVHNSNKVALRLLPCDVFARVAPVEHHHARFEIELALGLARRGSPVAALERRVEPMGYERDGFEVSLWTYYEPEVAGLTPGAYAAALASLHAGLREIDMDVPHFTDRVAEAQLAVGSPGASEKLAEDDRVIVAGVLEELGGAIRDHPAPEQLLHGEPHPGNVLSTAVGPLFVDLETCCRGPVEFDLAHVPAPVSDLYPEVNRSLLSDCRHLVLAMVAAWRWEPGDQLPNGVAFARELVNALRAGPPWPTIDAVHSRLTGSAP